MKKILFILTLALALPFAASAQMPTPYNGKIAVDFPNYAMEGDKVTFLADVDFSGLDLSTRQMVEFTPILRSTQDNYEERFAPVVVTGRQRGRVITRAEKFGDYKWAMKPAEVIVLKHKTERVHQVAVTVPFKKWMRHSELSLVETCTSCGNLQQEYADGITSMTYTQKTPYVFPAPHQPSYEVLFIEPEVEPVKIMNNTYSAYLLYPSGKSTLTKHLGNNAAVLDEVDRVIDNLKQDTLLTLKRIMIKGYASPEGSSASNYNLSKARAQAFMGYLNNLHNYRPADRMITSESLGEDWNGLRKLVDKSDLADRDRILEAIDGSSDNDKREQAIKAIDGGHIWKKLLSDYFPELRRNEYTIEYEVRGFNIQEAERFAWSRPELLSLNEFFMVAKLYDPSSREYKNLFYTASRMYPESPVAQFNTAAVEAKDGAHDSAIARLSRIDTPESWNNLGVAYWHKGEYDKALQYLQKAADAGLLAARKNIEQYNLWLADKD